MNDIAMNAHVWIFVCGHMYSYLLVIYHFMFPPTVYEGSNFSILSSTLTIIGLFVYSHPSSCEMVSHYSFILFLLLVSDIEYLFMCLYSEFLHFRERKGQLP